MQNLSDRQADKVDSNIIIILLRLLLEYKCEESNHVCDLVRLGELDWVGGGDVMVLLLIKSEHVIHLLDDYQENDIMGEV